MEILEEFDFDARPSRSRYAKVVTALVDEGKHAVKLKRGEDFPDSVQMDSVQGGVSGALRAAGFRAKTRPIDKDTLVVGLNKEPAPARRRKASKKAVAA